MEIEAAEVEADIEKEHNREKELTAEYDKEKDALNQDLGAQKGKLKEIAQARKYFADEGIDDKLAFLPVVSLLSDRRLLINKRYWMIC